MNPDGAADGAGIDRWDQALAWSVRLREAGRMDLTGDVGREWQNWCGDPENLRIFDRVTRLLADRERYGVPRQTKGATCSEREYDLSISVAEWLGSGSYGARMRPARSRNWWWLSGGILIAASLILLLLLPPRSLFHASEGGPVTYRTDIGILKDVHLSDGSSITLGGDTLLTVALSPKRRSVILLKGQAWFQVAHDPNWPFIVAAGDGTIRAVGTAFVVTRDSNRVVVAVTEGTVEVSARQSVPGVAHGNLARPSLSNIRVSRGEELILGDNGRMSPIRPTDTHAATAWTSGRLTFDDQPLRYVVEAINRYSSQHITVGPGAGALRFSGIVSNAEIGDWLRSLELIFPVTVDKRADGPRIQMRASPPATRDPQASAQP